MIESIITLLAVLLTWYVTKVHYTRSLRIKANVKISNFDTNELIYEKCSRCSLDTATTEDNLRAPFYCSTCR